MCQNTLAESLSLYISLARDDSVGVEIDLVC
jgi:hypothetical protein